MCPARHPQSRPRLAPSRAVQAAGCGAVRFLPFKAAADGQDVLHGADKTFPAITAVETSCCGGEEEGCRDGETGGDSSPE